MIIYIIFTALISAYTYATPPEEVEMQKHQERLARQPVRDLSKFPQVVQYLKDHPVYISMTSSPERAKNIPHVLKTLDLTHVEEVVISLPLFWGKDRKPFDAATVEMLKKIPKVRVERIDPDLGPITKLIPAVEYAKKKNPKSVVITVDDDIGYSRSNVNEDIYALATHKNSVAGLSGQNLDFWHIPGHFPKIEEGPQFASCQTSENNCGFGQTLLRKAKNGYYLAKSNPQEFGNRLASNLWLHPEGYLGRFVSNTAYYPLTAIQSIAGKAHPETIPDKSKIVDVIEGIGSVGYPVELVDTELMRKLASVETMRKIANSDEQSIVRSCFASDDLVISFVLAFSKIPRIQIRNGYADIEGARNNTLIEYSYGFGEDALHRGAGLGPASNENVNEKKYKDCFSLIAKVAFDSNLNRFRSREEIFNFLHQHEVSVERCAPDISPIEHLINDTDKIVH